MRRFDVRGCLCLASPAFAALREEARVPRAAKHGRPAVRFIRVDETSQVIEKDAEAG